MSAFLTDATPVGVWHALTDPGQTRIYLEGMALQSDWVPGSAIVATFRGEPTVLGEVLCVQAHHRLSYVIRPPGASAGVPDLAPSTSGGGMYMQAPDRRGRYISYR